MKNETEKEKRFLKYLGTQVKFLFDIAIRSCEEKIEQILKEPKKNIN